MIGRRLAAPIAALMLLIACRGDAPAWPDLKAEIRRRFPEVAQLPIPAFVEGHRAAAFLVDVREPEEYAVSHIEGAVNLSDPDAIAAAFEGSGRREIVLYCAVGYRSSRVARDLQERVSAPVYNLEGSIFEWANSGHPVFRSGARVDEVHPYDERWGRLLEPRYHPR